MSHEVFSAIEWAMCDTGIEALNWQHQLSRSYDYYNILTTCLLASTTVEENYSSQSDFSFSLYYIIGRHVPVSKTIASVFISDSINFVLKGLLINDIPWDCISIWFYEANQYAGWKSNSKLFCWGSPFYHGHHWTGSLALRSSNWKYAKLSSGSWSEVQFFTMVVVSIS